MTATAIGLDVGTNAVRAVEIELGEPPLIRRMGQVGLPAGAVVDGEVADVDAVSIALRRLWTEAGFKSRTVRAGISSARVIVRTVEMPRLSHDELMSTIRLQLDDYVPLAAEDTVFDIRPLDGPEDSTQTMQLLLAAAHRDAVEPLVMALRDAKLDATAIDVIPAALALALTHAEPDQDDKVDVVLSIGAGTVVVIAARCGEPMFSRTITSACGRLMTDRIASQLAIGEVDAERYKRSGATEDPSSGVAVLAARAGVDELIEEVRASLVFFADQPNGRPVRRLLVTGGGSLLPGLAEALAGGLGLDVVTADPFAGLRLGDTGFEPCDLPHLAPYMGAAIGVALGAKRPKDRRINLTPQARRASRSLGSRRVLLAAAAVVVFGGLGVLYVQGRSQLADQQSQLSAANAQLADVQTQLQSRVASTGSPMSTAIGASPDAVAASVASTNVDWLAVERAIEKGGTPLGVTVASMQGVLDQASGGAGEVPTTVNIGTVTLSATAPDLPAIADWIDALAGDPRFADPWAGGLTMITQEDGSKAVQFTMDVSLTAENLVGHAAAATVTP